MSNVKKGRKSVKNTAKYQETLRFVKTKLSGVKGKRLTRFAKSVGVTPATVRNWKKGKNLPQTVNFLNFEETKIK